MQQYAAVAYNGKKQNKKRLLQEHSSLDHFCFLFCLQWQTDKNWTVVMD